MRFGYIDVSWHHCEYHPDSVNVTWLKPLSIAMFVDIWCQECDFMQYLYIDICTLISKSQSRYMYM